MFKFVFIALSLISFNMAAALQYHPFLLQTKDSNGFILAKVLNNIYGEKIIIRKGICSFFEMQRQGEEDIEYELDECRINYQGHNIYTEEEKKNGTMYKGQIWVEGTNYRTRPIGKNWSEWKPSENVPGPKWYYHTGTDFYMQRGEFIFEPTKGLQNLRGDYKYMSRHRTDAIKSGKVPGILIQESGTGEIILQKRR